MDFPTAVVVGIATLLTIMLLAVATQRLLDVRFGALRTFLATLLAFVLAQPVLEPILSTIGPMDGGQPPDAAALGLLLLVLMCMVLIPMTVLVVAEALVPPGSLPGPLELARSVRGRLSRGRRYSQITRIAVRHGLGPYLRGRGERLDDRSGKLRLAASLRAALDDGGVTFVKLGQVLSTRRDLLPAEFVEELGRLQDQVAPASRRSSARTWRSSGGWPPRWRAGPDGGARSACATWPKGSPRRSGRSWTSGSRPRTWPPSPPPAVPHAPPRPPRAPPATPGPPPATLRAQPAQAVS